MAKRKRLTPANPMFLDADPGFGAAEPVVKRAPIAEVASEAAASAAMSEVVQELNDARDGGRMVITLAPDQISLDYLVRDRMVTEETEMEALMASIRDSGQRTPIDVAMIRPGHYGLISGWRRCEAIRRLQAEGRGPTTIKALLRRPESASEAYLAMVEENEIRVGLSYYERARIIVKVVEQRVFDDHKAALLALFRAASRSKRSKIKSFMSLVETLDGALRFPQAIGERLGLLLAKRLEEDPAFGAALSRQLQAAQATEPEAEQATLTAALGTVFQKKKRGVADKPFTLQQLRPGLKARRYTGRQKLELSGAAMTDDLQDRLLDWLRTQEK